MMLRDQTPLRPARFGLLGLLFLALAALSVLAQEPAEIQPAVRAVVQPYGADGRVGYQRLRLGGDRVIAAPEDAQLPPDAREALQSYTAHQEEARRQYQSQLDKARQDVIAQLQALQDKYTKAGKLDEAVAIRDRIRQMQRAGALNPSRIGVVQPAPADLSQFRDRVGQSFLFDVTGSTDGVVWGSDVYTDDSSLASAAVHAGALAAGQRGVVRVTIMPGQQSYDGATRNGVTSRPYGQWDGSYRVARATVRSAGNDLNRLPIMRNMFEPAPDPGTLSSYRDRVGQAFVFRVTGSVDGTIWGTDVYTDDSPLATAAVHAGIVRAGEQKLVRVTILGGEQSYTGSTRNGVTSLPYHAFDGSYRIEAAPAIYRGGAGRTALPGMGDSAGVGAPPATTIIPPERLDQSIIKPQEADPRIRLDGPSDNTAPGAR